MIRKKTTVGSYVFFYFFYCFSVLEACLCEWQQDINPLSVAEETKCGKETVFH